jgi:glutamate-1-semialdehyde 2,1-aminomutase
VSAQSTSAPGLLPDTEQSLLSRANALLPGGGVSQLSLPGGRRVALDSGQGCRVRGVDGAEYVDFILGSGPLILGHCHPRVVEAVRRQLEKGSTFYTVTEPAIELGEKIVEHVPCAEMVQYCSTGSEATHFALRLARAATGRDAVLKFEGGFHGAQDYAMMSLYPKDPPPYPTPSVDSAGVPQRLADDVFIAPFNDLTVVDEILTEIGPRVAAVIVEPVQRTLTPEPGFLEGLRSACDRNGSILIFDEVVTGFRLGLQGAQGKYSVTPDIATLGKIIGGGYPLAAVAGRRDLIERADMTKRGQPGYAYFSGTLNGNPIACVAGLATIAELERPGVYEGLDRAGQRLRDGLASAFAKADITAHVLGEGPLFQIVLADERARNYRDLLHADATRVKELCVPVVDAGFLVTGEKSYMCTEHGDDEIDALVQAFRETLAPQ